MMSKVFFFLWFILTFSATFLLRSPLLGFLWFFGTLISFYIMVSVNGE